MPDDRDYTERALQAARDAVESVPTELWVDRRNSETIAQAIAPDFADLACDVASEHQAKITALKSLLNTVMAERDAERLRNLRWHEKASEHQAAHTAEVEQAYRVGKTFGTVETKAALLARLGEPEMREAVACALSDAWPGAFIGNEGHMADAALAVITEKLT